MQNLLQSAVEFIFQPESGFSILFLVIFIVCFGYGIYVKQYCEKQWQAFGENAQKDYEAVKDHFLPDAFVNLVQKTVSVKENKLQDLPNVFVTIGILGTFIGLGIAIKGAAALLNDNNIDISKLNAVLGVIAFKFQISVWGTIFSLTFQKVISEPYFEKKQYVITDVLRSLYNNESAMRTILERQLEVSSANGQTSEKQLKELEDMQNNFHSYVDLAAEFAKNVNQFSDNVNIYHQQMLSAIEKTTADLIAEQENVKESAQDAVKEFISRVNAMYAKIDEGQQSMSAMQQDIHVDVVRSIEVLQKIFVRSEDKYMKDAQDRFNSMLKSSLMAIHSEYIDAAHKLSIVVDNLNKELGGIDTGVTSLRQEFMTEHGLFCSTMKEAISLEKLHRERVQECYANMEKIWASMAESTKRSSHEFQEFAAGVKNELNSLGNKMSDKQSELKNTLKAFGDSLEKNVQEHNKRLVDINSSLEKMINEAANANMKLEVLPDAISQKNISNLLNFKIGGNK